MQTANCGANPLRPFIALSAFCLLLCLSVHSQNTKTDTKTDTAEITMSRVPAQSPFYDALAFFYTVRNYKAYPLLISTGISSPDGSGDLPLFDNQKGGGPSVPPSAPVTATYHLIECATGKILDEVTGDVTVLGTALDNFSYTVEETPFRNEVIDSILARNLASRLPAGFTHNDIIHAYRGNTYILRILADTTLFPPGMAAITRLPNLINAVLKGSPITGKSGGALNTTAVLEKVTNLLVQRVNEEFNDAFLVHLYHALHAVPEFAILFPNTLESLDKIELTQYSASLNAVKAAYQTDIQSILSHIGKLATLQRYRNLIERHPVLTTLFLASDMLDGIQKKTIPAQLLYQVGEAPYIKNVSPNNYSSVVKLAALVSNALRDIRLGVGNGEKAGWVDADQIKYLRDDDRIFTAFLGLMAQNADGIIFSSASGAFDFQQALISQAGAIRTGHSILYNFSQTASKINLLVQGLKNTEGKALKTSDYVSGFIGVANELLGLSKTCLDVLPTTQRLLTFRKIVDQVNTGWLPLLKQADTVLIHVEDKDYQMAIYSAAKILEQVLAMRSNNLAIDTLDSKVTLNKLQNGFLHYGLFIASIASSKSPADVKEAISAFALPKGSSRIKKERCFTVGLNAYVGVYHANNRSYPDLKLPASEWGITAPIGIGMNWGLSPRFGHSRVPFSLSLYGGILDLGAIFTYKVQGGDTLKSDIQLGQVFSPSATLVLGLPIIRKYNIPLAIGANIQWGPKLHKVDDSGNSLLPLLVRRYSIFLAFDLPILNFYTSRKQTKKL